MRDAQMVAYLKNGNQWPRWPVCPVKKYDTQNKLVIGIVADLPDNVCVRELNIFEGWTPEEYESAVKHSYNSYEALVADGWEID